MFGIKIKNKFLQLKGGRLSFKLTNPLYLGDDVDVIPNSVMLNTDVPNSDYNAALLDKTDDLQVKSKFLTKEPCEIWFYGSILFIGYLDVIRTTDKNYTIRAVVNTIGTLKDLYLDELDFGILDVQAMVLDLNSFTDNLMNPLTNDWLFHPVWNPGFAKQNTQTFADHEFQNKWSTNDDKIVQLNNSALTPFLKLNFIFKKIFQNVGYQVYNGFQISKELQLITVYNNGAIHSVDGQFNYNTLPVNHFLQHQKTSDFLKRITRFLAIGIFPDLFNKTVDILKFDDVKNSANVHDWTKYTIVGREREQKSNAPSVLKFKKNDRAIITNYDNIKRFDIADVNTLDPITAETGLYSDPADNHLYFEKVNHHLIKVEQNDEARYGNNTTSYEATPTLETCVALSDGRGVYMPSINQAGYYANEPKIDCDPHLMFFRGFTKGASSSGLRDIYIPNGCQGVKTPWGTPVKVGWDVPPGVAAMPGGYWAATDAELALNWKGAKGVYQKLWKKQLIYIQEYDSVTKKHTLPLQALRDFKFSHKVAIKNMEYIVKEIDLEISSTGEMIDAQTVLIPI